jgi:amino-acid racemase
MDRVTAEDWRVMLCSMKHRGILAHSTEGAALCFRAFCQEGFAELGPDEHPDVSLARSMPAWEVGDYASIRATLAVSVQRLAAAGADFFVCPTTPRTSRSSNRGLSLPFLACTSPRWCAMS